MNDAFRRLHMPAELAWELFAAFSRMEYPLKVTDYASEKEGKVTASWDKFANDIDEALGQVADNEFMATIDYILAYPARKQVRKNGELPYKDQVIDVNRSRAQQRLLMYTLFAITSLTVASTYQTAKRKQGKNDSS